VRGEREREREKERKRERERERERKRYEKPAEDTVGRVAERQGGSRRRR